MACSKKIGYFRFAAAITPSPITDATTVTKGDNGDFVAVGSGVGTFIVTLVGIVVTGTVGAGVAIVVKGTGAALFRWDVLPVLKTVSDPYWFETVSRTS
jgi:hypothetical protein